MATHTAHPPAPPPSPPPEGQYDELTGVYGFFRRHQKKLLYTAGFFTLLTFSITGPVIDTVRGIFGGRDPGVSIEVAGRRVELEAADYDMGQRIAKNLGFAIPIGVLPPLAGSDEGATDRAEVLAVLLRAARAEGVEPSMAEVDKAIEVVREQISATSATKLATQIGFRSLADYREVMAEAMRIGTYVQLQALAVDTSDAQVLQQVIGIREKITMRVAVFDEKKLEEELKKGAIAEADLKTWLDAKDEREKSRIGIYDLPRAELRFGALLLADGQFDPEQWKEDHLKDFTVTDDMLQPQYEQEKDARFKLEAGGHKPFDDAAVKAELTRLLQAEQVMNKLLAVLKTKQQDVLKPLNEALVAAQAESSGAESTKLDLKAQLDTQQRELPGKETELAQAPEDAAKKKAVEDLKAAIKSLEEQIFAQEPVVVAKKNAVDAAEAALKEARASFDFPAAFAELTKDKKGFVQKAMSGRKNAEELKDLEGGGLELGTWAKPNIFAGMNKGDIGFAIGRTTKAVICYQVTDFDGKPLKSAEAIKPLAEGAYWTEQAKKQAEEKKKLMDDALLRLAKAKCQDKVTEIEGKRQSRIDERMAEWENALLADKAEAEKWLNTKNLGNQAKSSWQRKLDAVNQQLGQKAQQIASEINTVQKLIDTEIADEAKKHHKDVLDAAAAEASFTVADHGPYQRELQSREPRFDKRFDPTVVFLWRGYSKLKEGESTGVVQDFTNRRYMVGVCTKVEPLTAADVTRREFEALRTGEGFVSFAAQQVFQAYDNAFTREAIEKRYLLKRPAGEMRVEK